MHIAARSPGSRTTRCSSRIVVTQSAPLAVSAHTLHGSTEWAMHSASLPCAGQHRSASGCMAAVVSRNSASQNADASCWSLPKRSETWPIRSAQCARRSPAGTRFTSWQPIVRGLFPPLNMLDQGQDMNRFPGRYGTGSGQVTSASIAAVAAISWRSWFSAACAVVGCLGRGLRHVPWRDRWLIESPLCRHLLPGIDPLGDPPARPPGLSPHRHSRHRGEDVPCWSRDG